MVDSGRVHQQFRQWRAVLHRATVGIEATFEYRLGIGTRDGVHGVEDHFEIAGEQTSDRVEIEETGHQFGIIRNRIDHLDRHAFQFGLNR